MLGKDLNKFRVSTYKQISVLHYFLYTLYIFLSVSIHPYIYLSIFISSFKLIQLLNEMAIHTIFVFSPTVKGYISIYLLNIYIYLSIYHLSINLSIYQLYIYQSINLSTIYLSTIFIYLSIYLPPEPVSLTVSGCTGEQEVIGSGGCTQKNIDNSKSFFHSTISFLEKQWNIRKNI